jgi:hypothetical protein
VEAVEVLVLLALRLLLLLEGMEVLALHLL